ncbi:MAG: TolC family protein [Rhodoferax sp.]|nr:TolC family protein [Rhodoferax sp.]MCF8208986.1 TolC family protein [Rhodoferax sp.]
MIRRAGSKVRLMVWALSLTVCAAGAQTGTAGPSSSGDAHPGATLDSLLLEARARNPELGAMQHEVRAANERLEPAGALADPRFKMELQDVTKSGTQTPALFPSDVGATEYSLTQELPWSGKRALKRDIADQDVLAAQGRSRLTWVELAARTKAVFAQRYLVQGNQKLVGEMLELMLQLERVMQVRYAGGLAAQQDITRIHVEHTAMRAELVSLASEWRQSQASLNRLLGRAPDAPLAAPERLRALPEPAQLNFAALSERLRHANPQIFVEVARVRAAEKARDLAYKARYPDFVVGISAMQRQGDFKEWSLMLELNLPVRDSVLRSQERESEAMLAAAQARSEAAANQALAELAENLSALEAAQQTAHLMTYSLMPQAELTWQSALASYENGKGEFAMLLDAQRQIRLARQSQLKAQVQAQLRLADIERLLGEEL